MSLNRLPSRFSQQRPAPTPNGTVKSTVAPPKEDPQQESAHKVLREFSENLKKGIPFNFEHSTLASLLDAITHINSINDRKLFLEHALVFLSNLSKENPVSSELQVKLQNKVIELLYNDLAHPSATYLGGQHAWRTPDGSYNNVSVPDMGMSGKPYARSVQQSQPLPVDTLPDSGLVFDALLRREKFEEHPAGLSSTFFAFAALVIHTVFRTSHDDVNVNQTSSYVDLSPLYGNNQEAQDKVRMRDGRGLLLPDVFAEDRLLLLPPAVCVLLVLFSRNHNYIAKKLLEVNERGTYVDPNSIQASDDKTRKLLHQEEEIFQTARLINCAWFAGVVFSDYFSNILGLVRQGNSWSLQPFGEIRNEDHSLFERGQGNVCSVEFNCLYRWHATTSQEDEKWIEQVFDKTFKGKNPDDITPADFSAMAKEIEATEPDVSHWTFGGLERQENGSFKDEDLANWLQNSTEHPAAAFKARGTPSIMRLHEIMGIEQNRRWGVCSLNDFRKFLGLKTYASFKEWNPDPEIYTVAEKLYGHIDHLELYVGLQAEEAKPLVEGAGLCPGYTISRAILSDAIALTRGDRFYTADYTPFNMTTWGFNDCQRDPDGAGFGSMLGRLLLRTLPEQFPDNSVYAWFPLMTPEAMRPHLKKLGLEKEYDFSRPTVKTAARIVKEHSEVLTILKNVEGFRAPYYKRAVGVIKGNGFFLASEDPERGEREQREIYRALVNTPEAEDSIAQFFYLNTQELITQNSFSLVGAQTLNVDIVRDVLRHVPLRWVASEVAGIQLKDAQHPHGVYTDQELYSMLSDIYAFLVFDVDPSTMMVLRENVKKHVSALLRHIRSGLSLLGGVQRLSMAGLVGGIAAIFSSPKAQKKPESGRHEFVKRLHEIGHPTDHLANSILCVMVACTVELSLALTNIVNMFLEPDRAALVHGLSVNFDEKNAAQLRGYVWDAARIDPPFRGVYRYSQQQQEVAALSLKKDEKVFLDVASANMNSETYPNPHDLNPSRSQYIVAEGFITCLGHELTVKIMAHVVRAIFEHDNVRRGPGRSGKLPRYPEGTSPILRYSYVDVHSAQSPWPTSMVIQYNPRLSNGSQN